VPLDRVPGIAASLVGTMLQDSCAEHSFKDYLVASKPDASNGPPREPNRLLAISGTILICAKRTRSTQDNRNDGGETIESMSQAPANNQLGIRGVNTSSLAERNI